MLFVGIILCLPCCVTRYSRIIKHNLQVKQVNEKKVCEQQRPFITVWVHGTRLTPRIVCPHFFAAPQGLVKAADFDQIYHLRTIANTLSEVDSVHYPFEHIYLFGWSGSLDFKARKQAAEDLGASLKRVLYDFKEKYGYLPKVRIITHSHGGNVALYLGAWAEKEGITIDELILLACPVQRETMGYLKDSMFKKIFSLYSSTDLLQVIDPQGVYQHNGNCPLFSERRFEPQGNLVQARIRMNKHSLLHVNFLLTNFIRVLPRVIEEMSAWQCDDKNAQSCEHVLSISA